jgi:hypothetical protein
METSGDEKLLVQFYVGAYHCESESREAGRPIFKDAEFVKIMVPGNKDNIVVKMVTERERQRFPMQYAAFKNKDSEYVSGTPLKEWSALTPSQVEELNYYGIRTVEQLAGVTDANAQNILGVLALRQRGQAFLEACGKTAEGEKLSKQLNDLAVENANLRKSIAALEKKLEAK